MDKLSKDRPSRDLPDAAPLRVLVVDDERLARMTTRRQLEAAGFEAAMADTGHRALDLLDGERFDVLVTDMRMPGMDGIELLRRVRREHPQVAVILATAYATVETAVAAMREGAADYLSKPFPFEELEYRLRKVGELCAARVEIQALRARLGKEHRKTILGRSQPIRRVIDRVGLFGPHTAPVLITGKTGTGKEVVARALHDASPHSRGPFVAVPCGAVPATLAESELFGHERGAFTGATARRQGAFERAQNGTVLLDDLDDLPLEVQAKLLRVLQDGTFLRVGGTCEIRGNFRVIATSKIDLEEGVADGRFRADLFYRLRALEIHLPPLVDRIEDILPLAEHFLAASRAGREPKRLTAEALLLLQRHPWPGNVRELKNVLEAAAAMCPEDAIRPDHLPEFLRSARAEHDVSDIFSLHLEGLETIPMADVVRSLEDRLVDWAMRRTGGRQGAAAELLQVPRTTFQSKMKRPPGNGKR